MSRSPVVASPRTPTMESLNTLATSLPTGQQKAEAEMANNFRCEPFLTFLAFILVFFLRHFSSEPMILGGGRGFKFTFTVFFPFFVLCRVTLTELFFSFASCGLEHISSRRPKHYHSLSFLEASLETRIQCRVRCGVSRSLNHDPARSVYQRSGDTFI